MALPVDAWKLEGISPRAYQHPADRAATAALHKVPYLDEVVRRLVALGYERALRAAALGSSVRLGQDQLPHIWVLHRQSFNALDLEDVPDLYLTQLPFANAATIGVDRPIVVVNSELVRILDDDGRRAVLAHEAAHVHSGHVLYQTAMLILLRLATGVRLPLLAGLPLLAIQLALLEWFRGAELSCDRAAAIVTRDPMAICRALMVISAGEASADLNLDAFVAQAMDYSERGRGLDKLTRLMADMGLTHPMPVRRVRLLLEWVREGGYDRIVAGDYIRRGHEPPLRDEADAAQEHYAKRMADAFQQAGSSIGDVGQQLGDWLARQRTGGSDGDDDEVAGAAAYAAAAWSASRRRSTPRRRTRQTFICDMPIRRAISRWDRSPEKYRRMTSRSSGSSRVESSSSHARSNARRSPSSSAPSWSPTVRSSVSAWAGASSDNAQRPRRASWAATTRSTDRSRCSARSEVVGAWPSVALRRSVADSSSSHVSAASRGGRTAHVWSRSQRRISPIMVGTA